MHQGPPIFHSSWQMKEYIKMCKGLTKEKNKTGAKPGCDEIQYTLLKTKTKASRSFQIAKREFPAGWSSHQDKTTASR